MRDRPRCRLRGARRGTSWRFGAPFSTRSESRPTRTDAAIRKALGWRPGCCRGGSSGWRSEAASAADSRARSGRTAAASSCTAMPRRCGVPRSSPIDRGDSSRAGSLPFPGGSAYRWSPDWKRIAFEPPAPCRRGQRSLFSCYRGSGRIFVAGLGPIASGTFGGWMPDGRLVFYADMKAWARGDATILDLSTRRRRNRQRFWLEEQPIRSADCRYLAVRRGVKNRTKIIVSLAGGRVVQTLTTHYILSMFAWSTGGHLLAYTTSGFPFPHQLFVVDPGHEPRKIFATGRRHFDWITMVARRPPVAARRRRCGRLASVLGPNGKAAAPAAAARRSAALVLPGQRVPGQRPLT